jgi:hypothetical protein
MSAKRRWLPLIGVALLSATLRPPPQEPSSRADPAPTLAKLRPSPSDTILWIQMRDVNLHIDEEHVLEVRTLHGQVVPTHVGVVPILDDVNSFLIRVTDGTVDLTGPVLATLLNDYVFAYPGAPIRALRARTEGKSLVLNGIMHKGVDIPFEMVSSLSVDPDGRIRSHPDQMKILGVNGKLLLHALGLRLDKVLDVSGSRGATVQGDDMLLDPNQMIPPPRISGKLASIRVEGDHISQTFRRTPDDTVFGTHVRVDTTSARHFVYFRGGYLRFGKLMMVNTDLLIVDADESDPFDLYIQKYNTQLVAGYSKILPNFSLRVTMPDYGKVGKQTVAARPPGG